MKLGVFGVTGITYITLWIILAMSYIGTKVCTCTKSDEIFDIWLPILMGLIMIIPYIFGYLEGKQHNK
jgi:O-antigen/teichoic acid export membrane protein